MGGQLPDFIKKKLKPPQSMVEMSHPHDSIYLVVSQSAWPDRNMRRLVYILVLS